MQQQGAGRPTRSAPASGDGPPLVFVGVATLDTIALVERFPEPDERVVATELMTAGGGPAATAAVAAARLGHATAFAGTVGDDDDGITILDGLRAEGVDVSGVSVAEGRPSAASIVVVDASRSTRAIVNREPPATRLSDRAIELLRGARWVHVDQHGWEPVRDELERASRRPRVSIDAGNPVPGFSPAGIDLYVPTVSALRRRHGDLEPGELLRSALDEGARLVVATDGARGALASGPAQPLVTVPAATGGPVRSTLGAGDVFHGALLAAVEHGYELVDCLRYANAVAARSCEGLDGRSAIPDHDTVAALVADHQRAAGMEHA